MKKTKTAATPDAYVRDLKGWCRECVTMLRETVKAASPGLEEVVKWGHLVYFSDGPVLLIRAEDERVLFGFWRGKRLSNIEPRLRAGGKYEMATVELRDGDSIRTTIVRRLAREAVALNKKLGNPQSAAKLQPAKGAKK